MRATSTSEQRVDQLLELSDKVYPIIDSEVAAETRARRIVRLGIQVVAHTLESNPSFIAGDYYHALLADELQTGGLTGADYEAWPLYRTTVETLPRPLPKLIVDPSLDTLASTYADVRRATISANGTNETDASHAVHLSALALPYAAEHYPDLHRGKVATYLLLHDIVEAYAGDTPSLGMSTADEQAKNQREAEALDKIERNFQTKFPRFVQAIHAYEQLADDEARYVKTSDKLDPAYTHFANQGISLRRHHGLTSGGEFLKTVHQTTARMTTYAHDFPALMADRNELLERVARHTNWS